MDSIYKKQNEPVLLSCIAAQRKEYSRAKKGDFYKDLITVIFALFSIVASWVDNEMLTAIVFLFAIATSLSSKYFDTHTHMHQKIAALIQQYVDVTLYSGILKNDISNWGRIPTRSLIAETLATFKSSDVDQVKNWYSDYSKFSPIEQVFYCQKENLRWDINLRKEFKKILLVLGLLIMALIVAAVLVINPSVIRFLCAASWMLPLIDFLCFYWNRLQKDIERLKRLEGKCEQIDRSISKKDFSKLESESEKVQQIKGDIIDLQKEILEHRKESAFIPNWFYKVRQKNYQEKEDRIADEMKKL